MHDANYWVLVGHVPTRGRACSRRGLARKFRRAAPACAGSARWLVRQLDRLSQEVELD